ncbi:hypothetical protein V8E36_006826 [Tilletia maclaganii]
MNTRASAGRIVHHDDFGDGNSLTSTQGGNIYFGGSQGDMITMSQSGQVTLGSAADFPSSSNIDPIQSGPSASSPNARAGPMSPSEPPFTQDSLFGGPASSQVTAQQQDDAGSEAMTTRVVSKLSLPGRGIHSALQPAAHTAPPSSQPAAQEDVSVSRNVGNGDRTAKVTHRKHASGSNVYAFATIPLYCAQSNAARNVIEGAPESAMFASWRLEAILVFDPASPPSCLKKTKGTKTAFFLDDGRQVKETWRCRQCGAERNLDPRVTNALHRHYKQFPQKENSV